MNTTLYPYKGLLPELALRRSSIKFFNLLGPFFLNGRGGPHYPRSNQFEMDLQWRFDLIEDFAVIYSFTVCLSLGLFSIESTRSGHRVGTRPAHL